MTSKQFIAIVPDKKGAQESRLEVRKDHLSAATKKNESGQLAFAGAMIERFVDSGVPQFRGSVMIFRAESEEEVMNILKADVYAASVWDLDAAQITPLMVAFWPKSS